MGEEISRTRFNQEDRRAFGERLRRETALLRRWFELNAFEDEGYSWGFEIEAWLLDHNYFPNPANAAFLRRLSHPMVVHELSRFNVELNTPPLLFEGDCFSAAERDLSHLWQHCNHVAHGMDANMVLIGTLPTIRQQDLCLGNISDVNRYHALNAAVLAARDGRPLQIDIKGEEHLLCEHHDVMLEAGTTSLQVHFKVPVSLAHRYLNASMMMSAPILALCGNSPLLFGRQLWEETRIPLFEQAIGLHSLDGRLPRVGFGGGYAESSLFELFEENLRAYPPLLPLCFDDPDEAMRHLSLHNGTIWRWNRPLVGVSPNGSRHLRIEQRILPAGPSLMDMLANAAFYLGLVHEWVQSDRDLSEGIDVVSARDNFYAAARYGLAAQLKRQDGAHVDVAAWLPDLLDLAARGLDRLGVAASDVERYLQILRARLASGQTGAAWQRKAWQSLGGDAYLLMARYAEQQRSLAPVHEWEL